MITAVDTSVLLDVFAADPRFLGASQAALRRALHEGALVASEGVFAELRPWFRSREALLEATKVLRLEFTPVGARCGVGRGRGVRPLPPGRRTA